MSHPASIHPPMTVPEASARIFSLEADVNAPGRASDALRAVVGVIAGAFRSGQFIPAANWLVALNANTVGVWEGEAIDEDARFWWRGRTLDDDLEMLAEAFAENTMGITTPYWEIALPEV